ncbi:MAG: Hpt domain-containing protein [Bdellovibrio sp.]|nr:Hpt domain-containing protein [Bdellovibrio sp.]
MSLLKDDPEFQKLRDDFLDSLKARKEKLILLINKVRTSPEEYKTEYKKVLEEIKFIAHRLAGVAGFYGLSELGYAADQLDAYLDNADLDKVRVLSLAEQLSTSLRVCP